MQSIKACLKSHLNVHMPIRYREILSFRGMIESSVSTSAVKNESRQISFDGAQSQAKHYVSLIKDPLWQHVCKEIVNMMGPHALLKMGNSRLGSFSPQDKTIDLYCRAQGEAHFVQQYDFVILGSLQRYFPTLKEIRVLRELH